MSDRPIIFSAPMVRALLDGRKTQTRRVLKPQPVSVGDKVDALFRFRVGDRLWVREAFAKVGDIDDDIHACPDLRIHAYYRADAVDSERQKWRSPIHMPRWASRLTLTVTDVRVQRLQDISEADAEAEGARAVYGEPFDPSNTMSDRRRFELIWSSTHGPDTWGANPWVVALTFTVHKGNIDDRLSRPLL